MKYTTEINILEPQFFLSIQLVILSKLIKWLENDWLTDDQVVAAKHIKTEMNRLVMIQ